MSGKPVNVTVTMGGTTLTSGTGYTYTASTGTLVFKTKVTGNIVVTGHRAITYSNLASTTGLPTTIAYNTKLSITMPKDTHSF